MRGLSRTEAEARAFHYIRLVGLADYADAWPRQLSGGMAQRVGIARALTVQPGILLLDEPFGALDAMTKITMQEELVRIWREERVTMILVTHDLEEAIYLGDRVLVLARERGARPRLIDVTSRAPATVARQRLSRCAAGCWPSSACTEYCETVAEHEAGDEGTPPHDEHFAAPADHSVSAGPLGVPPVSRPEVLRNGASVRRQPGWWAHAGCISPSRSSRFSTCSILADPASFSYRYVPMSSSACLSAAGVVRLAPIARPAPRATISASAQSTAEERWTWVIIPQAADPVLL